MTDLRNYFDDRSDDAEISWARFARHDVRNVDSNELFRQGEHEIAITHGEAVYRLKMTRQGKLVLNK